MCCPYNFIFAMIQKQFKAIEMNKNAANCLNPPFISQPILNLKYIMRMSESSGSDVQQNSGEITMLLCYLQS